MSKIMMASDLPFSPEVVEASRVVEKDFVLGGKPQ